MCVCAVLLAGAFGCEKSEPQTEAKPASSASEAPKEAMDPTLAKALADAKNAPPSAQPGSAQGGPPPRGVFQPGEADKEAKPGAAPKLTLGSAGSEPRVRLSPGFGASESPSKARVVVALQANPQQGALPVQFDVDFTAKKLETDSARSLVTAKVVAAGLPSDVRGQVPPTLATTLAKLRGSSVRFETWADGGATGFAYEAPKDVPAELGDIVRALSDGVAATVLPLPSEPVGKDGFWMATSRDGMMGVDFVTYRMVRVLGVRGDLVTLSVSTKRYAASSDFAMEGLQGKFTLEELASGGEGQLAYRVGHSVPESGAMKLLLAAALIPAGQPEQRGQLQMASQISFLPRSTPATQSPAAQAR